MHKLIAVLVLLLAIWLSSNDLMAQRYKRDAIGTMEMVKFEAYRNGGMIEFQWDINTTREIKEVEIQKGKLLTNEVSWTTVKKVEEGETTFVEYDPDSGQMFYKLILVSEDGTVREYNPTFKIKGKS
ncbi:MAG: hypothetical protein ACFCUU_08075 [Cyclobacteriaceae bacterium]